MRNKLPCTARTLTQLQPDMIQSVVGPQVFQLGKEYHSANCVQILEADDDQILSEVTGPFGLYEQTIQLKGGNLLTKCSCTSSEEPFCRHCVAVLLGYHQPGNGRDAVRVSDIPVSLETVESEEPLPSVNVNLHHMSMFVEWLQRAMRALDRSQPLPEGPALGPGDVTSWIRGIQNLHARWRVSEEKRQGVEADLIKRESQLERLMGEFQSLPNDVKEAQAISDDIQNGLANARAVMGKLCDVAKEQERLQGELNTTADELLGRASKLNSKFASIKDTSAAVEGIDTARIP
jgi:hypothetical protein